MKLSTLVAFTGLFLAASALAELKTNLTVHVHRDFDIPFESYTSQMEAKLGTFNQDAFEGIVTDPAKSAEVKKIIESQQGSSGLMLFAAYDHGGLLTIKKGHALRAKQYVIGNPLIAATMTEHDLRAALYAPVRVLVFEGEVSGLNQLKKALKE